MTFPSPHVYKILFTGYGRTPLIRMLVILTANYQDQLGLSGKNKGDTEKFPEFLQKNNLKCLYKFEILVPFKVLPL